MNLRATKRYVLRAHPGRITLFRCLVPPVRFSYDVRLEWEKYARGGFTVIDVPVDHVSLFEDPYVAVLAETLKTCLLEAL